MAEPIFPFLDQEELDDLARQEEGLEEEAEESLPQDQKEDRVLSIGMIQKTGRIKKKVLFCSVASCRISKNKNFNDSLDIN